MTRSFDVYFDLRLNKRLSKQSWGWWFETPSWSLWRQCNDKRNYQKSFSARYPAVTISYPVNVHVQNQRLKCQNPQLGESLLWLWKCISHVKKFLVHDGIIVTKAVIQRGTNEIMKLSQILSVVFKLMQISLSHCHGNRIPDTYNRVFWPMSIHTNHRNIWYSDQLSKNVRSLLVCKNSHVSPSYRVGCRFPPSQWEMALLCNDVSHWLGTSLESAMC